MTVLKTGEAHEANILNLKYEEANLTVEFTVK